MAASLAALGWEARAGAVVGARLHIFTKRGESVKLFAKQLFVRYVLQR